MKVGDMVKMKYGFHARRGTGLILRLRQGAVVGTDKSIIEVMWPDTGAIDWHSNHVLEVIS